MYVLSTPQDLKILFIYKGRAAFPFPSYLSPLTPVLSVGLSCGRLMGDE